MRENNEKNPVFASWLLGVLLTAGMVLLVLLLFAASLGGGGLPAGAPGAGGLPGLLSSWILPVLAGVLTVLLLVLLGRLHARRFHRWLFSVGVSALAAASIAAGIGLAGPLLVGWLPADWQNVLVGVRDVFRGFCLLGAGALLVLGAGCLSGYFCITAGRRSPGVAGTGEPAGGPETPSGYTFMPGKTRQTEETPSGYTFMPEKTRQTEERRGL